LTVAVETAGGYSRIELESFVLYVLAGDAISDLDAPDDGAFTIGAAIPTGFTKTTPSCSLKAKAGRRRRFSGGGRNSVSWALARQVPSRRKDIFLRSQGHGKRKRP